jgi:hypothetical protein
VATSIETKTEFLLSDDSSAVSPSTMFRSITLTGVEFGSVEQDGLSSGRIKMSLASKSALCYYRLRPARR